MNFEKNSFSLLLLALLLLVPSLVSVGQEVGKVQTESKVQQVQTQSRVVASVNEADITEEQLSQRARIYPIIMTLSQQHRAFANFLMTSESGQTFLSEYRKRVLDDLIMEELKRQKIQELGITVKETEVQKEIDNIIESNDQFENEQELRDYLKKNRNSSLSRLKSRIRNSLKNQKLKDQVTGEVTVTEEEVSSFYEENKARFTDQEGNTKTLEEVRNRIVSTLKNQKLNEKFTAWLKEEREKAKIEKYPERLD